MPLLLIVLILFSHLLASHQMMTIDSGLADYDGKQITLNGDVQIEHPLGVLSASHMCLIPEMVNKQLKLHQMTMRHRVKIALKDGSTLTCSEADIDYHLLVGHFKSGQEQDHVIFSEEKSNEGPLVVKSKEMVLHITPDQAEKSFHHKISAIEAYQSVSVNYHNEFFAAADKANYKRIAEKNTSVSMPGLISLQGEAPTNLCQVTSRQGDLIKASRICIDTIDHNLLFAFPKGAISTQDRKIKRRIDFSADTMTWDEKKSVLTLRDNVIINQPGMGTITTDEELRLVQHLCNGVRQLQSIETFGKTELAYADTEHEVDHTLVCYGRLFVDHEHLKTVLESPRDASGRVVEGKQVLFHDYLGQIYADKVTIFYTIQNNSPQPERLVLEGHVRILNQNTGQEESKALQYALADRVEYLAQAKELNLSSIAPKRVLFFDKLNNLQVSAPSLKIYRDQTTNKDAIQGQGDVRFSFVKQELEELQKLFPSLLEH